MKPIRVGPEIHRNCKERKEAIHPPRFVCIGSL